MVTETRTPITESEIAEAREEIKRHWDRMGESIEAGLVESGAEGETRGVAALASLIFSDQVVHEFDDQAGFWCTRLVEVISSSPMMTKLLNAYQLELDVTDCADIVDGPLGKAIDGAVEVLLPIARVTRPRP